MDIHPLHINCYCTGASQLRTCLHRKFESYTYTYTPLHLGLSVWHTKIEALLCHYFGYNIFISARKSIQVELAQCSHTISTALYNCLSQSDELHFGL
jgi:hypothetical protein